MTNSATHTNTGILRACYEQQGHIQVPDLFEPETALHLGIELDDIFERIPYRPGVYGEQKRKAIDISPSPSKHPNLTLALGVIGTFTADVLEHELWPAAPGSRSQLETIDMIPRHTGPVKGIKHRDLEDLSGPVAIATYEGESELWVEDGTVYDLRPGGVVILNNSLRLLHQGSARCRRRAIVLANLSFKKEKQKSTL